jgi:hypothetical protein
MPAEPSCFLFLDDFLLIGSGNKRWIAWHQSAWPFFIRICKLPHRQDIFTACSPSLSSLHISRLLAIMAGWDSARHSRYQRDRGRFCDPGRRSGKGWCSPRNDHLRGGAACLHRFRGRPLPRGRRPEILEALRRVFGRDPPLNPAGGYPPPSWGSPPPQEPPA